MIINPYIFGAAGGGHLLDDYPAELAFGLNKLGSSSTNCIRVRRSSDSSEQDIGFSGDDLDTTSLESFCSGTDGFIAKWYNQGSSGGTYDLAQTTAGNQPKIVSSGTTLTDPNNSNPAMLADGSSDFFSMTAYVVGSTSPTSIGVYNRSSAAITSVVWGQVGGNLQHRWKSNDDTVIRVKTSNYILDTNDLSTGDFLDFISHDGTDFNFWRNNTSKGATTGGVSTTNLEQCLKSYQAGSHYHNGYFQVAIWYDSDEESNRTGIQDALNNYYGIY